MIFVAIMPRYPSCPPRQEEGKVAGVEHRDALIGIAEKESQEHTTSGDDNAGAVNRRDVELLRREPMG